MKLVAQWFVFLVFWAGLILISPPVVLAITAASYGFDGTFWMVAAAYGFLGLVMAALWVAYR